MTQFSRTFPTFVERVVAAAHAAGSKAQSLRGALRYVAQSGSALPAAEWHVTTRDAAQIRRGEITGLVRRGTLTLAHVQSSDDFDAARSAGAPIAVVAAAVSELDVNIDLDSVPGYSRRWRVVPEYHAVASRTRCVHHDHVTEWRGGRARTAAPARTIVYVRCLARIAGPTTLEYDMAGRQGVARAPNGWRWTMRDGHVVLTRARQIVRVDWIDLARGLYDGASGRQALRMPRQLREQYGEWEYGPDAAAEIERKLEIDRACRREARATAQHRRAVRLLARISSAPVVLADARSVGHCLPGIESWCRARGVNPAASVPCRVLARDADSRARDVARAVAERIWSSYRLQSRAA